MVGRDLKAFREKTSRMGHCHRTQNILEYCLGLLASARLIDGGTAQQDGEALLKGVPLIEQEIPSKLPSSKCKEEPRYVGRSECLQTGRSAVETKLPRNVCTRSLLRASPRKGLRTEYRKGAFAKGAGMFFAGLSCVLTPDKNQE